VIFVDQAADASLPSDAVLPKIDRFGQQDPPQMALIPDQGAVQDLAPASDVDEVSGTYTMPRRSLPRLFAERMVKVVAVVLVAWARLQSGRFRVRRSSPW
jgi:hypothetical protein